MQQAQAMSATDGAEVIDFREQKPDKYEEIERWLSENYGLRYNVVKAKIELRPAAAIDADRWEFISDYWVNSTLRQLRQHELVYVTQKGTERMSLATSKAKLVEIIESDFVAKIDPIKNYLTSLPPVDAGAGYIEKLASTVTVKNDRPDGLEGAELMAWRKECPEALWPEYLKRWLVATAANAMSDAKCLNHTCLVLISPGQGKFKTTWLNNLCPKPLHQYLFSSQLNLNLKETVRLVSEMFIVNIDDQLGKLNRKDADAIKNMITMASVQTQRPYQRYIEEEPHRASFCASVNERDILVDSTGNRRFLPFEIESIDIDTAQALNMDRVWAEAMAYLKEGFKYWFNQADMELLNRHNQQFRMLTMEEDLLGKYFNTPEWCRQYPLTVEPMTNTDIMGYLTKRALDDSGLRAPIDGLRLNRALLSMGFERKQRTYEGKARVRCWLMSKTNIQVVH